MPKSNEILSISNKSLPFLSFSSMASLFFLNLMRIRGYKTFLNLR
jgi:hypothetical protein